MLKGTQAKLDRFGIADHVFRANIPFKEINIYVE